MASHLSCALSPQGQLLVLGGGGGGAPKCLPIPPHPALSQARGAVEQFTCCSNHHNQSSQHHRTSPSQGPVGGVPFEAVGLFFNAPRPGPALDWDWQAVRGGEPLAQVTTWIRDSAPLHHCGWFKESGPRRQWPSGRGPLRGNRNPSVTVPAFCFCPAGISTSLKAYQLLVLPVPPPTIVSRSVYLPVPFCYLCTCSP